MKGVLFLTQSLLPLIADSGRIVNVSSGLTRVAASGWGAYAAMKSAVETDFFGGAVRKTPNVPKLFADMTALGRVGAPDDIGLMIASLLSEENRRIHAGRIEVANKVSKPDLRLCLCVQLTCAR